MSQSGEFFADLREGFFSVLNFNFFNLQSGVQDGRLAHRTAGRARRHRQPGGRHPGAGKIPIQGLFAFFISTLKLLILKIVSTVQPLGASDTN